MKNANFSESPDLKQAAALSRRLRPDEHTGQSGGEAESAPATYTGFRATGVKYGSRLAESGTDIAPGLVEPDLHAGDYGPDSWESLLRWTLQLTNAHSAFLIDGQGLVVTAVGELGAEEAEAVGARLLGALSQAAHLPENGAPLPTVCIGLNGSWLNGFSVPTADDTTLTLGAYGEAPLADRLRKHIEGALSKLIAG